jgi:hypothetical protein
VSNKKDEDAQRRGQVAHYASEILVRWLGGRPGAGAEQVEAYSAKAIESAEALCKVCALIVEDPDIRAKREQSEAKAAQKAADEQAKKDADARDLLAKANQE